MVIFTAADRAVREATGAPMKALAEPKARARVTAENCMVSRRRSARGQGGERMRPAALGNHREPTGEAQAREEEHRGRGMLTGIRLNVRSWVCLVVYKSYVPIWEPVASIK